LLEVVHLVKVEGSLDELRELMGMASSNRSVSRAPVAKAKEAPTKKKSTRKLSAWNRYVANSKNRILHKSGPRKGRLNLKAMARKFRSSQKKR
tara:strand:+ start:1307 stop:1585 length:279 start_codon:yes stop_codon:yes gene_type:complete